MITPETVRPPMVSGSFYPADRRALRKQIDRLLEAVPGGGTHGKVRGLVAPHAGYMYSGFTAAHAYRLLRPGTIEAAVIIAPSHRELFRGVTVYPGAAYATPLGDMAVSSTLRTALLAACPAVRAAEEGHRGEHAVEVHLPFLQSTAGAIPILPLVMGEQSRAACAMLGGALAEVLGGTTAIIIASTDLSHFHAADAAHDLDATVMDDIRHGDPEALLRHLERGEGEACGGGPAAAALHAFRGLGVTHMTLLHHSTSADVTGDRSSVVGYLSAAALA